MGICDHKNTCQKCCLRLRLIMEDKKCPYCKTELEEILVTKNKTLTWEEFERKFKKKAIQDTEDPAIMYMDKMAVSAGMELRSL